MDTQTRTSRSLFYGVCACFFLSGFAALLYQTAWLRQFSTVFGTSELAVATVLSAYMGGLAFGAAVAGRFIDRINRPVLAYGFLEGGIAVSALLVPMLMDLARLAYVSVLGGQPEPPDASGLQQPMFYFLVTVLVLGIPTAFMGATLPLLIRHAVTDDAQIGTRVGLLYAINTVGAVAGTIAAAFMLLPALGLAGTVYGGVLVNAVVFGIAVLVARSAHEGEITDGDIETDPANPAAGEDTASGTSASRLILPVIMVSGTTSFVYEVLWTRLLAHVIGGSVAAFATMLASFLTGIAIGSAVAGRLASDRARAVSAFAICQLGIAAMSVLIYYSLNHYLAGDDLSYTAKVVTGFLVLVPATLFIGATFPLAVRIAAPDPAGAASSSARVYAWNTLGAILGAAVAAFFLLPILNYEGTLRAAVIVNLCLAVLVAAALGNRRSPLVVVSSVSLVFALFAYRPGLPLRVLQLSPIAARATEDIEFYEVGRSATVMLYRENGAFHLRSNGLPEAAAVPKGTPAMFNNQRMLGALPVLARPDARSALIVGLGAGSAITGVPKSVTDVDVIELEPAVVAANRLISARRKYQPLADPRVSVIVNDARSALSLTEKQYDIIVSQPSHPWSGGASHLYSLEYMQLVAKRLTADGVYLQWINSQFLDEGLLRSLCATILEVYPHVRVYQFAPQVLFFLASASPLDVERKLLESARPFRDDPLFYLELGVATVEDVVASLMMDEAGVVEFAFAAVPITDDKNLMAMRSADLRRQGQELAVETLGEVLRPWVPALNADHWLHANGQSQLRFPRVADTYSRLAQRSYVPALVAALREAGNPQADLVEGRLLRRQGQRDRAQPMLANAYQHMVDSNDARYAVIEPWLRREGLLEAEDSIAIPESIRSAARAMTGVGRAVVESTQALLRRDLQAVANADAALGSAGPAEPWFAEAVKLRVDWRNSVRNPELKAEFADQAWQILDLAMANESDHEFLAMRIASAGQSGRFNELMESTRAYADLLNLEFDAIDSGYLSPGLAELEASQRQLRAIAGLVASALQTRSPDEREGFADIDDDLTALATRVEAALRRL